MKLKNVPLQQKLEKLPERNFLSSNLKGQLGNLNDSHCVPWNCNVNERLKDSMTQDPSQGSYRRLWLYRLLLRPHTDCLFYLRAVSCALSHFWHDELLAMDHRQARGPGRRTTLTPTLQYKGIRPPTPRWYGKKHNWVMKRGLSCQLIVSV